MKKILFLHGFFASGSCLPARALKSAFQGKAIVLSPDLPLHPQQALTFIQETCNAEQPQLLVGNSCGAFYAQMIASLTSIPALLGNPHFEMTRFLSTRLGRQCYKAPRADGRQEFEITPSLIDEFAQIQARQFLNYRPDYQDRIWGIFGEQDTLAPYEPVFLQYYTHSLHFPGAHTPTPEEVCQWYAPAAEQLMECHFI